MKRAVLSAICLVVLVSLTASQSWAQEPQDKFSYSVYLPMVGESITRGPGPPLLGPYPPSPPIPIPIPYPPHQQRCNSIAQAAASRLAKKFAEILTSSNGIKERKRLINKETEVEIIAPPQPEGPYWRDRIHLNKSTPTDEFEVQFKEKKNPLSFSYSIIEDLRVEGEVILKDIALQLGIPDKIELNTLEGSLTYRVSSGWLKVKNVDENGPPVANITNIVTTIDNTCAVRGSVQATDEVIELAQAGEGPNSNRLRAYVAGGIGVLDLKAAVSYTFTIGGVRCPSPPPVSFDISSELKLDTLDFYRLDNTHRGIFVHPVYPLGDVSVSCSLRPDGTNEFKVTTEYIVPFGYGTFRFDGGPPSGHVTSEPASRIVRVILPGENEAGDPLGLAVGGRCEVFGACSVTYILTDIEWMDWPGWTLDYPLGRTVTCRF